MGEADNYLTQIIRNNKAQSIEIVDSRIKPVVDLVLSFTGNQLQQLMKSGSSAKGTAIRGVSDLDLFISLKSDTTNSLKEIYNLLDQKFTSNGFKTRRQNSSIGISHGGFDIDLVPGKVQSGYVNYHSICVSRGDSWMQTNVKANVDLVVNSGRTSEIVLGKTWRKLNKLEFPSVYLELTFIQALKGKSYSDLANNFFAALQFLAAGFVHNKIIDPSNSNNEISGMLTNSEKQAVKFAADVALSKKTWGEIVW